MRFSAQATSGIGLFLAHLSTRTDLVEARATACAAIRQFLCRIDDVAGDARRGFYSGLVGIAYAAAWVGMLTDEPQLVERGLRLAHRSVIPGNDHLLDVIGGNAGALAPLLWLARLPGGERLADGAIAFAEGLAGAATKRDATWCWNNDRACGPGVGSTPLCGLAHDAAGMGLALIEAGVACGRDDLVEGGLAAFRYEDQLYDTRHENWPDLRERSNRHDDPSLLERPSFMVAWCHGAAGIGLTRLRAIQLVPERRAELIVGAKRALRATIQHLRTLPTYSDASPCHGRGWTGRDIAVRDRSARRPRIREPGTAHVATACANARRSTMDLWSSLRSIQPVVHARLRWNRIRAAAGRRSQVRSLAPSRWSGGSRPE
jgi:lantibiotic biosynthesis protein